MRPSPSFATTLAPAATAESAAATRAHATSRRVDPVDLARSGGVSGSHRILELKGRRGVHPTSIHSTIRVGSHNLNAPRGTLRLWFFALEDLAASVIFPHMATDNPHFANYCFLGDCPAPRDYGQSNFFFGWFRQNELRAQFFRGGVHQTGFLAPQKAWVQAIPFNYFEQHHWYQAAITWDEPAKEIRLYVNGLLVGVSDRFNKDFHRERCGDTVYAGCPALCHGEFEFIDAILDEATLYRDYRAAATDHSPEIERALRKRFYGDPLDDFTFRPEASSGWVDELALSLTEPDLASHFYVQGETGAVKYGAHPEGLLVETPEVTFEPHNRDRQVYLWTERMFEGDLYVEFDWKSLRPGGLSLLITQATGMSREDFMTDYPRKTCGQMHTVHGENVRNYHWEFYREMHDVRNDVGTAFSRKNPFAFRNGFGSAPAPFAPGEWHRLQYLQEGGRIRGAIDGKILLEVDDDSRRNTGCVLNCGHLAIRAMLHSKMLYRNLRVFNRPPPFRVVA